MKIVKVIFLCLCMLGILKFLTYNNPTILMTAEEIVELSSKGYPKSEDFNTRFEELYKKFGNGKAVPYKFIDGTEVLWEEIYANMDHLLEE